ncbi:60S ribosomal protein L35 [Mitosporidium daphniae]
MSSIVKAHELRNISKAELMKQLSDLKQELSALRVNQASSATAPKLARISVVRKSIARVLTVIQQQQRSEMKAFYAGKKYKPLDIRPKKTRAIRRRMTKSEINKKTERQRKKAAHFPKANFVVLA